MTDRHSKRKRKSSGAESTRGERRTFYAGLIQLHLLHHAAVEPVYGLGMIEELRRHGYDVSAGTLYPILHRLERRGLLKSSREQSDGVERRLYRATAAGRKELATAKVKVRELFGELFEHENGGR
jgi:DNA-binding PadR family transcriptional regulator